MTWGVFKAYVFFLSSQIGKVQTQYAQIGSIMHRFDWRFNGYVLHNSSCGKLCIVLVIKCNEYSFTVLFLTSDCLNKMLFCGSIPEASKHTAMSKMFSLKRNQCINVTCFIRTKVQLNLLKGTCYT